MSRLYASPLRVYLFLAAIAAAGILCGFNLPVSLFPNTSKPKVGVSVSYGGSTADDFYATFGRSLEDQLRAAGTEALEIEKLTSNYESSTAEFNIEFKWGTNGPARKEIETAIHTFSRRCPRTCATARRLGRTRILRLHRRELLHREAVARRALRDPRPPAYAAAGEGVRRRTRRCSGIRPARRSASS